MQQYILNTKVQSILIERGLSFIYCILLDTKKITFKSDIKKLVNLDKSELA